MRITSLIFDAFLKCATKCYLRSLGEVGSGNEYAEWVRGRNESYEREAARPLQEAVPEAERVIAPPATESLKTAKWRLAVDLVAQTPDGSVDNPVLESRPNEETRELGGPCPEQLLESRLHAVERVSSEARGKPAQFAPIRFVFRNKLTKDDRLLLAFDALVLSHVLGREVSLGKIIHGDDHATLKVKTSALAGEVRKRLKKMAAILTSPGPPDLVLNRHCAECEFQVCCRQKALEKDDLSLLAGMSANERQKLRSKGIFTVTQLSYTFRPRRRPKRMRDKREKYHHSLKALAIREKKIHIVGSPELNIEGTPVYLDVEGLPDRDFYYLIGVRIGTGESAVQHSLWADTIADEGKIWREFLATLDGVEKPVLIHYGSYETIFLKRMCELHGRPAEGSAITTTIQEAVNVVPVLFAHIYFPTYTNGLKDIADTLDFKWSAPQPAGLKTIIWRHLWEESKSPHVREKLITYNAEDCQALEVLIRATLRLGPSEVINKPTDNWGANVVHAESIPRETMFGKFTSPITEFEQINKAARWDYQRDRIYARSSTRIRRIARQQRSEQKRLMPLNKVVVTQDQAICPDCGMKGSRHHKVTKRVSHDIFFGNAGIKRWVVEYRFRYHWCAQCRRRFGEPQRFWRETKYGRNLVAYYLYQLIELQIPRGTIQKSLRRLFGYDLCTGALGDFKEHAAQYYSESVATILARIKRGTFVHVDETRANVRGKSAYVWVFTNLHEVVYLYADSRDGELVRATLSDFSGVLVSDFFSVYDAMGCPQQKCLLHLMRDLNADLLKNPYDDEVHAIIRDFAELLHSIVAAIDRFGLKAYHLHKHTKAANRFFEKLNVADLRSEAASKCRERFEKNRTKLFTFLDYDGVSWNNNNAEHAVKAFAHLRDIIEGSSTRKGIEEYLVLLSVCQSCIYSGVDFLDFLRSGEKDIETYARSRQQRRVKARVVLRDADGSFSFAPRLDSAREITARPSNSSPED
jgi:predicted RecB family nuclease